MKIRTVLFLISFVPVFLSGNGDGRRLGKLPSHTWDEHYALGNNYYPYQNTLLFPNFEAVGALISKNGTLGSATLIAPNLAITAAHIFKNRYDDPYPLVRNWEFVVYHDYEVAPSSFRYGVEEIVIHPFWISRQTSLNPLGDGDKKGVDLALVKLSQPVTGLLPVPLPLKNAPTLGQKVYVSGFGNLVEGETGDFDLENSRRMAGVNILDRLVREILVEGDDVAESGGLLAFDFDAPDSNHNSLKDSFDNLPSGSSEPMPIEMEVSTAEGDSGGPLFARVDGKWRIFGTVSYGSSDSTYGDITVFSRVYNHLDWIWPYLPSWPEFKMVDSSGWLESEWFGLVFPTDVGWNYHAELGWLWAQPKSEASVWAYINQLGWIWFSHSTYPFCYSENTKSWLYFAKTPNQSRSLRVYDFANNYWRSYTN